MPIKAFSLILCLSLFLDACHNGDSNPTNHRFDDITLETRLNFRHTSGVEGRYLLPEIMGSGGALFDYDNDGDLDIYLVNGGNLTSDLSNSRNRMFERNADGSYEDVSETTGLDDAGFGMGSALGDIDNDGDLDIYVSNFDSDRLYLDNGDKTFTDVTTDAGIRGDRWSSSATFCDIDEDGYLDLYVATYVTQRPLQACADASGAIDYCAPNAYRGEADQLYRNNGDGTFTSIGEDSGISVKINNALGVVCFDFNGDHHDDFFVANDGEPNHLWINRGNGTFDEHGIALGVAVNLFGDTEASMGIALGDVNADHRLDLLLTHLDGETNTLYLSTHDHVFVDGTTQSGLGRPSIPYTGFGVSLFDADQDGTLDIAIANGRVRKEPGNATSSGAKLLDKFHHDYSELNHLMINLGSGKFADFCTVSNPFCNDLAVSRGLLTGDIDGDGDLDILITNSNGPARLYRNSIPDQGGWLKLRLLDPTLNRDAIGARVQIKVGGIWQIRPVIHSDSYLSSHDATVHFGLGDATAVDEIIVTWPDGYDERFPGVTRDQFVVLSKNHGSPIEVSN
ncbi:MAG: CRTAC1 family protein [Pseudomonadales bacterium]